MKEALSRSAYPGLTASGKMFALIFDASYLPCQIGGWRAFFSSELPSLGEKRREVREWV